MAWTRVQSRNNGGSGDAPNAAQPYNSNVVAGNLLVMSTGLNNSPISTSIASVTDTVGTVYSQVAFVAGPSSLGIAVWAGVAPASGANTVTVTFNGNRGTWMNIYEYSGSPNTVTVDAVATNTGSSTLPDSGSATTSANGDLIFGSALELAVVTNTAGTAITFTKGQENQATFTFVNEDGVQTTAGSVHADWGAITSVAWSAAMVAFSPLSAIPSIPGGQVIARVQAISRVSARPQRIVM